MDPILLQKQLRDNSADLQDYYKDIQSWGEEMKRKEALLNTPETSDVPLPRNKIPKKEKSVTPKKVEVAQTAAASSKVPKDFTYWEKFDVDAECERIDKSKSDDDSDLTDEYDEAAIETAQEEKEKGNKYVKAGLYTEALKCYTQAIASFNYDATFYANRALCHLKLEQFKSAEADCTIAIQLDDKYIKAMHRRAVAREALKQYKEAKADLDKVLCLEPENKESQKLLDKIEKILKPPVKTTDSVKEKIHNPTNVQRPVSKFTASRQNKPVASTSATLLDEDIGPAFKELVVERKRPESTKQNIEKCKTEKDATKNINNPSSSNTSDCNVFWPSGTGSDIEIVKSFTKSPKTRSRVPLRRVEVTESTLKFSTKGA